MATKTRGQNPVIGDTVTLQMFVFNSNNYAELDSINQILIYWLDPNAQTEFNPDGRTLIETIPGSSVTNPDTGEYELDLYLDPLVYTETGRYLDVWDVTFESGDASTEIEQLFQIYPDLWYTTPIPVVYDFNFYFQPNRIRKGNKKYIEIQIIPNVPTATDLATYYENLAIASQLLVTIKKRCGDCVPCEEDLNIIVDAEPTTYKEKNRAFYFFDTTDYDCGTYDIYFELIFGENTYVSDTNQIQVYD